MAQKQYDPEKLEKEKKRSSIIAAVVFYIMAVAFALAIGAEGMTASAVVVFLIFAAAGTVILFLDKIQLKFIHNARTPGTRAYENKQKYLADQMDKIRRKAHEHKSLHDEIGFRTMAISGTTFGVLLLINLALLMLGGVYYVILVIAVLVALAVFIYSLTGKEYTALIDKYAAVMANEQEAEEDFRTASLYRPAGGAAIIIGNKYSVLSVSSKQVIYSNTLVWVFGRRQIIYNYYNGIYTGRSDRFYIYFAANDGNVFECLTDEPTLRVVIDDCLERFPGICAGYSPEVDQLFRSAPADFAAAPKPPVNKYDIIEPEE